MRERERCLFYFREQFVHEVRGRGGGGERERERERERVLTGKFQFTAFQNFILHTPDILYHDVSQSHELRLVAYPGSGCLPLEKSGLPVPHCSAVWHKEGEGGARAQFTSPSRFY